MRLSAFFTEEIFRNVAAIFPAQKSDQSAHTTTRYEEHEEENETTLPPHIKRAHCLCVFSIQSFFACSSRERERERIEKR